MALDKTQLADAIKQLLNLLKTFDGSDGQTSDDAVRKFADDLAQAIDNYIKEADISVSVTDTDGNTLTGTGTIN